jgi:hypothetical protein
MEPNKRLVASRTAAAFGTGSIMKPFVWLASLLALFGLSVGAQEELPPEGELLAFIYESLSASIPEEWEKAWMNVDVSTSKGKENISVEYFYLLPGTTEPKRFNVSNTFGPPNAASFLKKHAERKGQILSKFRIEMLPGNKVRLMPL